MGFSFCLCRICSLQSLRNVMHKLICFAGLWPRSALFLQVLPLVASQEFYQSKASQRSHRAIFIFSPSIFHVIFLCIECKCTLQTECLFSATKHVGIKYVFFFLACPSLL